MQTLYAPTKYPESVRKAINLMPPLATQIANRWMLGWPKRVQELLASGEYLSALKQQDHDERNALARAQSMTHLAQHEIAQEMGLRLSPP